MQANFHLEEFLVKVQSYEYQLSDYNWTSLDLIRRVEVDMSAAPWGAISMMKLTTQASFSDKSESLVESLD